MFKQCLSTLIFCATLSSQTYALTSNNISYDSIVEAMEVTKRNYSDHIPHWRRLFNTMPVRGFLECGCGLTTNYFLDNAQQVVSIEYITPGYGDMWFQYFSELFSDKKNWTPLLYNGDFKSNSFNNACAYQCAMHQDYAQIDATYIRELFQHFKALIKEAQANGQPFDVAFVDPGVYIRGDMVKVLLAHKIPIVAAHDTLYSMDGYGYGELNMDHDVYGWGKITTPSDYTRIDLPSGEGATFWINNDLPDVIASMQQYGQMITSLNGLGLKPTFAELTEFADEGL